jgi:hypothetical protein
VLINYALIVHYCGSVVNIFYKNVLFKTYLIGWVGIKKGVIKVPETKAGRDKIVEYLEENDISVTSLAVAYGIKKQDMSDFLTGRKITPRGNRVILKIISDLRIK